jgi:hypothetical protein
VSEMRPEGPPRGHLGSLSLAHPADRERALEEWSRALEEEAAARRMPGSEAALGPCQTPFESSSPLQRDDRGDVTGPNDVVSLRAQERNRAGRSAPESRSVPLRYFRFLDPSLPVLPLSPLPSS